MVREPPLALPVSFSVVSEALATELICIVQQGREPMAEARKVKSGACALIIDAGE
jgi:hypothetical protein